MATKAPGGDPVANPAASQLPHPTALVVAVAGWASIGAGAIHATAAGSHSDHRQAAVAFVAVAAFQLLWGVVALVRYSPLLGAVGLVGQAAAFGGWLWAKTSGIPFVDGLQDPEPVQFADAVAAVLAIVAILSVLALATDRVARVARVDPAPVRQRARAPQSALVTAAVALTGVALVVPAMVSASSHDHTSGDGHGHGDRPVAHDDVGHAHDGAVETHPFDPTQPIDLSGMPGVTPEQQAQAENLLAVSLLRLPQFADVAVTESRGYHSVGDSVTGYEHYMNWSLVDDGRILDPDYPESLVYRVRGPERELVAAMFMLPTGTTLDQVPDLGGNLLQWHIHNNLCFSDDPVAPQVASVVSPDGSCPPPTERIAGGPMVHVWIEPHPCGPFAALEGIAGGQIAEGETRLCDHVHGTGGL
jgi:hypothetical protein